MAASLRMGAAPGSGAACPFPALHRPRQCDEREGAGRRERLGRRRTGLPGPRGLRNARTRPGAGRAATRRTRARVGMRDENAPPGEWKRATDGLGYAAAPCRLAPFRSSRDDETGPPPPARAAAAARAA